MLIDVCQQHGMWLDKHELQPIVKRSKDSDLLKKRKDRVAEEDAAARNLGGQGFIIGYSLGRID